MSSKIGDGGMLFLVGRRTGCGFGGPSRGFMEAECIGVPWRSMAAPAASVASMEEGARVSPGREVGVPTRPSGSFGALERVEAERPAFWPSRMVSLISTSGVGFEIAEERSGENEPTSSSIPKKGCLALPGKRDVEVEQRTMKILRMSVEIAEAEKQGKFETCCTFKVL